RRERAHEVRRAPRIEGVLLGGRDDVVGRRDRGAEIADLRRVVAQRTEGTHDRHDSSSSAARSADSRTGPARSTCSVPPFTDATVDAPPGSTPPSTYTATASPK